MKRIEQELRVIRQQMEEDFVLHCERASAQKQSIERVERALDFLQRGLESVRQEFGDFARTTRVYQETWLSERQRNMRLLDVVQSTLLTGGLETESRLEGIEHRLTRLEGNQSGAA